MAGSSVIGPADLDDLAPETERPTGRLVPADQLAEVPVIAAREVRPRRSLRPPNLVVAVSVVEREHLLERLGPHQAAALDKVTEDALVEAFDGASPLLRDDSGRVLLKVRGTRADTERRLALARHHFQSRAHVVEGMRLHLTVMVGYVELVGIDWREAQSHALQALAVAESRGDLVPVAWDASMTEAPQHRPAHARTSLWPKLILQALITYALGVLPSYAAYVLAGRAGHDARLVATVYVVIATAMLVTTVLLYVEGFLALDPERPQATTQPPPPASAVIAAYLPNEAATIVETVESFLAQDYSAGLQVVLAYNTPTRLPVEDVLEDLAARDPRLVLLHVPGSTSKAQNVNAALDMITGEMVGVFDADHHPAAGAFARAWQWLAQGFDVVQGHCVIRNGPASWVSRTVAVEFEAIYGASHPGRYLLHDFGIFGGSNGYWRADVLRQVRMRGTMLTEDIDASFRVLLGGRRLANDPALVSRELAPATLTALVAQRLRWAQGWFQVSRRYLWETVTSPRLTLRQRLGSAFMLGWRELYPWIALQMWPLLAYALLNPTVDKGHWIAPSLLLATAVTTLVGPSQALIAYFLSVPEIRRHGWWYLSYALLTVVFYVELRNVLGRVAQLKQLLGEKDWRVTPRHAQV